MGVAFSPDGKIIAASAENNQVFLWDPSVEILLHTLSAENNGMWSLAFAPRGGLLAVGGLDNKMRVWNIDGNQRRNGLNDPPLETLDEPQGSLVSVAFSPPGDILAGAGWDSTQVWTWRVKGLGKTPEFVSIPGPPSSGDRYTTLAYSPLGATLAAGSQEGRLQVWGYLHGEGAQLEYISEQIVEAHLDVISDLAFSPDGRLLASAALDGTVRLWQVNPFGGKGSEVGLGPLLRTLYPHKGMVSTLAFSPDGSFLAIGYNHGALLVFDMGLLARLPASIQGAGPADEFVLWQPVNRPAGNVYARLPATSDWQNIMEFEAGQRVSIRVVGGSWGVMPGLANIRERSNGAGIKGDRDAESFMPEWPVGALIGRLVEGKPFMVGNRIDIRMSGSGRLQLRINDYYQHDNTGWLLVQVVVGKQ
ncbi:WD40 repeat domain-containing protein [Chloroflexota bacterium]